jgi:LysM repeat protein
MRKIIHLGVLIAVLLLGVVAQPVAAQGHGTYVVQPGDTLFSIAARFNVSVSELATINGIYDVNRVFVGQVLVLPAPLPGGYPPYQPPPPNPYPNTPSNPGYTPVITTYPPGTVITTTVTMTQYVVKKGDNLSSIAVRFKTTPQAIMNANGITNPNLVYVGQLLNIPRATTVVTKPKPTKRTTPGKTGRVYIVQPGDNMFLIAAKFNRDVYDIAEANGILNLNYIYAGQALYIP